MPIIVATAIRAIIQMAVTLGIISFAEKYLLPLLNRAISEVAQFFGVTEQDANDIVANEYLQFAEQTLVGAAALKAKTPTVIAEKLGFTSKGFVKRTLSGKAASAVAGKAGRIAQVATQAQSALDAGVAAIASAKGGALAKANEVATLVIKVLGVPVGVGLLITNTVDFAAWPSSAYQGTFQKLLGLFGVEVDKDYIKSKVLSEDQFNKINNTYLVDGVKQINDPFKGQIVPYTRENIISLADKLAAAIITEKGSVTTKQMFGALTALMIYGPGGGVAKTTGTGSVKVAQAIVPAVKVVTGVVQQGTLGEQVAFTARETDLIDTAEELQAAARNNLSSFIPALLGRIVYELKVVSSVVLKDGTRKTGSVQKVISGYNQNGSPKYRNVTNRFAILNIYVFTERNVRTKISTIILGPTDAVKLNLTQESLESLQTAIAQNSFTTDTKEEAMFAGQEVSPPAQAIVLDGVRLHYFKDPLPGGGIANADGRMPSSIETLLTSGEYRDIPRNILEDYINRRVSEEETVTRIKNTPFFDPTRGPVIIATTQNPFRCSATTLFTYFEGTDGGLPPMDERAKWYETFGLGPAAWYTGTAEQNVKLLAELKRRSGC